MQTTSHIMMIRPVRFGYNAETAVNNAFQDIVPQEGVQEKALNEFNRFALLLIDNGIDVLVFDDTAESYTPDSIFPNNWVSFHNDGSVFLYPMFAENRRLERKPEIIQSIRQQFSVETIYDLSTFEKDNLFLEGTGSMVLDRENKIAYACFSPRTNKMVLDHFCHLAGYTAVTFRSTDKQGADIYHSNVMMCVADRYVVICLESISNKDEQQLLLDSFQRNKKVVIPISMEQVHGFAGNMLQVENKSGEKFLVMSTQAYHSLNATQVQQLESFNTIIHADIATIETNGGGSTRCMMAEIHLPKK